MFVFKEEGHLVTVTCDPSLMPQRDPSLSFDEGVDELLWAYRFDFLLDLTNAPENLNVLACPILSGKWTEQSKGRDVGRRSAIVSRDPDVLAQVKTFKALYPYRVVAVFSEIEQARDWIESVSATEMNEALFI